MKNPKYRVLVFVCTLLGAFSQTAVAEVLWQDFSVTYLKGNNYRVEHPHKQVLTIEHASATSWGDSFFFFDHLRAADGGRENYAEWSPRLSGGKLLHKQLAWGIVKDVLLAGNIEFSGLQTNFLYGLGLDLEVPGFQYLQLNGYRRANDHKPHSWQLTTTWGLPFQFGQQSFLYDGFIDWTATTNEQRSSFNMTSQLKWAVHSFVNLKTPLYVGFEYVYWRNKYGIQNTPQFLTHETNLNLLVKAHF